MLYSYAVLLIYFASGFMVSEGASALQAAVAILFCALWVLVCYLWFYKIKYAFHAMLIAFLPVAFLVLENWYRRIVFIVEHGGMDCADCSASPMAFLLGVFFESIMFLLGLIGLFVVYRRLTSGSSKGPTQSTALR